MMIEKRFIDIWCSETGHIGVTDCGIDKEFTSDEFEDFLNELNDENDILKQQLQTRYIVNKQYEELQRLKKENDELKKQVEDCRDYNAILYRNCVQKDRRWLKRIKRVEDELEEYIKENVTLKQRIKENVFGGYEEGSLADLEFKAIAYDDIVELKVSDEPEPRVVVICKQGKKENVKSFCQMFIPFSIAYEIVEMIDDE